MFYKNDVKNWYINKIHYKNKNKLMGLLLHPPE